MLLFIIGLIILIVGGFLYSKYVEKQLEPDDRETPAVRKADGVDFVAMSEKKNWLINLLNIAGTGPILGPIQGILFGPIAFIAIPIGCVFAGAVHDFCTGFISMRNGGSQVPKLVGKYIGEGCRKFYNIVIAILLLLTGVVFVYTPGDLIANDIMGADPNSNVIWVIYAVIFAYYILSTVLPIDKLIGRIYPIFGAFLIISAIGVLIGIIFKGNADLSFKGQGLLAKHPLGQRFIPSFFITVACGILSGFHGSQVTLVSRTVKSEKEAKTTFYSTMIAEGIIAMIWAAGAMVIFSTGTAALDTPGTLMVGEISRY
ncbi:carbon starvation CstA family protein, partial [Anaerococcus sp.]